jgi:biopolymer transport protein ExbD
MSRRKKKRELGEVELNLAAMLDMAFQLLTFFILTFKPAPIEGQVSLRLPDPKPIATNAPNAQQAGNDASNTNPVKGVNTLIISVFSTPAGKILSLGVGEANVGTAAQLNNKLQTVFADPANPFEQVVVQVSGNLRYDELMKVVEVCTKQKMPDGSPLSKLSFLELAATQ